MSTHIVGDIEATCENVAVLDEGIVLYNGTVTKLLEDARGKIYSADVSKLEIENVKKRFTINSMVTMGNHINVRFIVDDNNKDALFKGASVCEANVEDAYMYLMHKKRGER